MDEKQEQTPHVDGSENCIDCNILFWSKDLRGGRCIDCIIKYYKEKIKEIEHPPLFVK
jgi:hypothetical protein